MLDDGDVDSKLVAFSYYAKPREICMDIDFFMFINQYCHIHSQTINNNVRSFDPSGDFFSHVIIMVDIYYQSLNTSRSKIGQESHTCTSNRT